MMDGHKLIELRIRAMKCAAELYKKTGAEKYANSAQKQAFLIRLELKKTGE